MAPAYGQHEMVKLTRLVRHEDMMTRDKALVALQTALQKPQLRASGVHSGLVPALQGNLEDESMMVRAHTANAFDALATHPLGSAAIVADGTHVEILKLIDDSEDTVRVAAYGALISLAKSVAGAPAGEGWSANSQVAGGGGGAGALNDIPQCVSKLVSKCLYETEQLQPFALELLGVLLQQTKGVDLALLSVPGGIDTMNVLLDSENSSVRQKAANNLSALTFPAHAKPMAKDCGVIEKLVKLLKDMDFQTRAAVRAFPLSHALLILWLAL